jgi:hypothetical protein
VRYRLPDGKTRYEIVVENPDRHAEVVRSVTIDGLLSDGAATIPLLRDGQVHCVRIVLG